MGWLVAILSGILAGLSYPTRFGAWHLPDLGFLAFFCWVPLFQVVHRAGVRRAFALAFVAGLFHYMVSQYWLYSAIHYFGGLGPLTSVLVMSLLFLVLAAYFGIIFLGSQWVCRYLRIPPIWVRPFFWVGIEYLRHYVPMNGYPWSQMGYTLGEFLPFIQIADLLGVYGVTFLIVLCNEMISFLLSKARSRESRPMLPYVLPAVVLLIGNLAYGYFRLHRPLPAPLGEVRVGVIQGNIPQEEKWNRAKVQKILTTYRNGTQALEKEGAQLIIWPEASVPFSLAYDTKKVSLDFGNRESDLLIGAITASGNYRGPVQARPTHNSALVLNKHSEILAVYHKKELVPFGEYVPYKDFFFFAKKLVAEVGDLQPGESFHPIPYGDYQLGVLICYEDIFPYISREMVSEGANVLVNITNDAWYGNSSAAYQHQVYSQLRSVETRRYLIRGTNTGISSLIDNVGAVVWQGGLYTRENFLTPLPFYGGKTLYVKIGDVLPQLSLVFMGMLMIRGFWVRRKSMSKER